MAQETVIQNFLKESESKGKDGIDMDKSQLNNSQHAADDLDGAQSDEDLKPDQYNEKRKDGSFQLNEAAETEEEKAARRLVEERVDEFKHQFDEEQLAKLDNDLETYIDKNAKGKKKK